jgi:hypothetical protein
MHSLVIATFGCSNPSLRESLVPEARPEVYDVARNTQRNTALETGPF